SARRSSAGRRARTRAAAPGRRSPTDRAERRTRATRSTAAIPIRGSRCGHPWARDARTSRGLRWPGCAAAEADAPDHGFGREQQESRDDERAPQLASVTRLAHAPREVGARAQHLCLAGRERLDHALLARGGEVGLAGGGI